MIPDDKAPTRQETEVQLNRILASKAFATHRVLRRLLERLVRDSLDGNVGGKDYETTLAVQVFDKPANWTPLDGTTVRQGIVNLRKRHTRDQLSKALWLRDASLVPPSQRRSGIRSTPPRTFLERIPKSQAMRGHS